MKNVHSTAGVDVGISIFLTATLTKNSGHQCVLLEAKSFKNVNKVGDFAYASVPLTQSLGINTYPRLIQGEHPLQVITP